jgi:hypothetical protein
LRIGFSLFNTIWYQELKDWEKIYSDSGRSFEGREAGLDTRNKMHILKLGLAFSVVACKQEGGTEAGIAGV